MANRETMEDPIVGLVAQSEARHANIQRSLEEIVRASYQSLEAERFKVAELTAQRDSLKAEVEQLKTLMADARALVDRGAIRAWNDTHYRTEPLSADRKRVIETHDMFRQALHLLNPDAAETEARDSAKDGD